MTARRTVLVRVLVRAMTAGLGSLVLQNARATPQAFQAAVAAFTGGQEVRDGRVKLDIDTLVENGNAVPVSISVQSPMTAAEHVQRIGLFALSNPQPEVAIFHLGPRCGRALVATRMRLATSQPVTALALMNDGTVWRHSVDVVVTLAACLEGG